MGLQIAGKIPADMGLSLGSLAKHFDVYNLVQGNAHEAKYDTQVTMLVFRKLLEML
jgi:DNA polymerase III alpha subunit (gram-positive type)